MKDLAKLLSGNDYPGRGIVLGQSRGGRSAVAAYFIMGRSANSRNRVFEAEGDGIRTRAFDESKMEDPSLIIYRPVRKIGNLLIVTNGDQTDTVYDFIRRGDSFEDALRTRCFEPDAPNYTPRISGMLDMADGAFRLSIIKGDRPEQPVAVRYFYEYAAQSGEGRLIHTYAGDGMPLPSFAKEPERVALPDSADALGEMIWDSLHKENRVSLFVRYIDLASKEAETRIYNQNAK